MNRLANRAFHIFLVAGFTLLAVMMAAAQDTRVNAPIPHNTGQSVSPSFEGWYPNPDGTRSLVFGYFNRNYDEQPYLPIGPENRFEPGRADRGQPTHFYPRRQTGVLKASGTRESVPGQKLALNLSGSTLPIQSSAAAASWNTS